MTDTIRPPASGRPALLAALAAAAVLAVILTAALAGCGRSEPPPAQAYRCPMHPSFTSDRPGDCSICGMRLVPIEPGAPGGEAAQPLAQGDLAPLYRCPMHPEVTDNRPGQCSICGMDLVPVPPEPEAAPGTAPDLGTDPHRPGRTGVQGPYDGSILVSASGQELAGVRTATASQGRLAREIRANGRVTADETRIRHVHTKIAGWVEKLHVNTTGQFVRAGETILAIYSPELLAGQEELLSARRTAARFADSELEEVRRGGQDLFAAARRRLELFDVPAGFIDRLLASGKTQRSVPLAAPVTGFVTAKQTFEGHQVEPGLELFTITDLSRVWIEADFYEYEAGLVRLGRPAVIELPHDPGRELAGKVAYVYPYLDPVSRTLRVRLEFDNPDNALKPEMFVDVRLQAEEAEGVLVPDSAVLDSGLRQVVFVHTGEGRFEPRQVKVGMRSGGQALLLEGVQAGEEVVAAGNFLLDSESRLRSALAGAGAEPPQHAHGGETQL